jgi:hypothetical protein
MRVEALCREFALVGQFEQLATKAPAADGALLTSARLQLGTVYSEDPEQLVVYRSQVQLGPVALKVRQQTLGGSVPAALHSSLLLPLRSPSKAHEHPPKLLEEVHA